MLDISTTSVRKIVLISIFSECLKSKILLTLWGVPPPRTPWALAPSPAGGRVRIQVALAREPWDASHPHSHTLDNIRVEYEASVGLRCTVPWVSPAGTSQNRK